MLNPKYIALLESTSKKYSQVETVNSSFEGFCQHENKIEPLKAGNSFQVEDVSHKIGNHKKKTFDTAASTPKVSNDPNKQNNKYHIKINTKARKNFSAEEDKLLLDYIQANPEFKVNKSSVIKNLEKILKRTVNSITRRIYVLQKGAAKKRTKTTFTFTEDKMIIDEAIKHFEKCKILRETVIQNPHELSQQLNRNYVSIEQRWSVRIRSWLLQYYNKNLNLEIRPMLADFVYRHFDSVKTIDWEFLTKSKEFSGHTDVSLRLLFYSRIVHYAAKFFKKPSYELTLKEINSYAKSELMNKSVYFSPQFEKRQMDCIEYFVSEIAGKALNISCSLN